MRYPRGGAANYRRVMAIARQFVTVDQIRGTRVLEECGVIAQAMMRERMRDRVKAADHYVTKQLWATKPPRWARGQEPVAVVSQHVFFRLES